MERQPKLFNTKGDEMEEKLRNYFLNLGYYVSRGVKYKHENVDITDIDIFLYERFSSISRKRINVDIKYKKQPHAFERILWTKGLKELLQFDSCIVATSDTRAVIKNYSEKHKITLMDKNFLGKLSGIDSTSRISEEEFIEGLTQIKSFNYFNKNKTWLNIYEDSKSTLLSQMDFSGFNYNVNVLQYFLTKIISDKQNQDKAIRLSYIIISYLLLILDYINKDIAFLEENKRKKILSDGLKFGNLGKDGIDKTIKMALRIAGSHKSGNTVKAMFDEIPTDILTAFFVKNENSKNLFNYAKEFEKLAFSKSLENPSILNSNLKGTFAVFLDYFGLARTTYLENNNYSR